MLVLLAPPAWAPAGQVPQPLPATVPAALLVVLAAQAPPGAWIARDRLAAIFWPEAAPADALHHLRINLHRSRTLLDAWGRRDALVADRTRVRLDLPTDLAEQHAEQQNNDAAAALRHGPPVWLPGWQLTGYELFGQWADEFAQSLHSAWLQAGRPRTANPAAPMPAAATPAAEPTALPGRAQQLQRLLASPAPALLLLGEAGAGKTTLLRTAYPQAPCLRGLEGLHAMPYRPLLDVLREQVAVLQRALREPSHPLRAYRLDLARVLPELAPEEALPPLDATTAQTRLVEALARAFEALTPLLLVDDLQWCDPATVEWLLMLAYQGRLPWRAAVRRHEIGPALESALQGLRSAVRLEEVDVPPLDRAALALACQARWPQQALSPEQIDRLHALSAGNAFLLGELLAAGAPEPDTGVPLAQANQVLRLVRSRLQALPAGAQRAVEAAAVFVQPVPPAALGALAGAATETECEALCARAVASGLLHPSGAALACRHDLIRQAVDSALPAPRRMALHRHAALWLAEQPSLDALTIAEHWRAAGEPQTALAWRHRGAEQLKSHGDFDAARALWREVADDSLDATQALRARLELAACDLFDDLARGEAMLAGVQAQLGAVADAEQRRQIESRALAARVDNRVFAGDIAAASRHAQRLRVLLPRLPLHDRVDALEVLIELAMRQPDIGAAWACLAQLREAVPQRPTLLSFEGQIHWFGGEVQAAHDALARLLERHPDYCRGITVENDLAVMLQALGRIDEAEAMARRSLNSWAGVAHTETLSLLVLGLVLTSAGRHEEADTALLGAHTRACQHASPGFEAEALVRRARLLLQCGRMAQAQALLDEAAPLLATSPEPLRLSQLVLAQGLAASAAGQPLAPGALERLEAVAGTSTHPLVKVRLARLQAEQALARRDLRAAAQAANDQAAAAQRGGLLEPLAEAWLLQARVQQMGKGSSNSANAASAARALVAKAQALARRQGFVDLHWRASETLARLDRDPAAASEARAALARLRGSAAEPLFDAAAAARREPRWDDRAGPPG
jgi:hypothetical protein